MTVPPSYRSFTKAWDSVPAAEKTITLLTSRLLKEEKELEFCMSKLEVQRDRVSSDVLNPIFVRYKDRLESLSPLHQEIETELESIRKRASEEIDFLGKELKPIQKRLEEFQSLYKLGAVTKPDFVREKTELRKEIKSRERSLKKHQQILFLSAGFFKLLRQTIFCKKMLKDNGYIMSRI